MSFIYAVIIILSSAALFFLAYRAFRNHLNGVSAKKIMKKNLLGFVVILAVSATLMITVSAAEASAVPEASPAAQLREDGTEEAQAADTAEESDGGIAKGLGLLAAGLVTGLAGIGGGIAVAAGAPAAIAAASEDPKSFGKSLIFVALGESIALYGVVISILIINKV